MLAPRALAAVVAVAARLDAAGVPWLLGGSAGRALHGYRRRPRDIDVEVAESRILDAARALGAEAGWVGADGVAGWRASAVVRGVEVDVTAGLVVTRRDGPPLRADFALERAWGLTRVVAGRAVRAAPPEEQVAVAVARGDWAKVARIATDAPPGARLRAGYLAARLAASAAS